MKENEKETERTWKEKKWMEILGIERVQQGVLSSIWKSNPQKVGPLYILYYRFSSTKIAAWNAMMAPENQKRQMNQRIHKPWTHAGSLWIPSNQNLASNQSVPDKNRSM